MPTPEESRDAALRRAQAAEEAGNEARAATWYASVARWEKVIELKERMAESKARVQAIQERIDTVFAPVTTGPTIVYSSSSTPIDTSFATDTNTNYGSTQSPGPSSSGASSSGDTAGTAQSTTKVDPNFTAVPFSQLDANTRSVLIANAAANNMTPEQYYNMRGGVNKAGYYGDSWNSKTNLTDAEYAKVVADAIAGGASGSAIGAAINAATEAKARASGLGNSYSFTGLTDVQYTQTMAAVPLTASLIGNSVAQNIPVVPVKTAPIDTILLQDENVPVQLMYDLVFENIGGQELINIARNDTVNGQNIIYQPIKNLTAIQQEYNPNNIVALQSTSDKYFQNFSIKLENKIPQTGTGPNGEYVYIDPKTGALVIELVNLDSDEQVELEINTSGTIYEAEL